MGLSWLCNYLPVLMVWTIGGCVAISRWPRHPRVSALILASIGAMILATIGWQIVAQVIVRQVVSPPGTTNSRSVYIGLLTILAAPIRLAGWISVLAAIFSERELHGLAVHNRRLQFSVRGLLLLTAVVAVLCAAARIVFGWLGDSSMYLLNLLDDIPIMICWLCGGWIAIARWPAHPQVSLLTLIGVLFAATSFLLFQAAWKYIFISGNGYRFLAVVSSLAGLTSPVFWSLLLVAAFGWRTGVNPFAFGEPPVPFTLPQQPRV